MKKSKKGLGIFAALTVLPFVVFSFMYVFFRQSGNVFTAGGVVTAASREPMRSESFSDLGNFESIKSFYLDGGRYVAAVGQLRDNHIYLNVYDAHTLETVRDPQMLSGSDAFADSDSFTVLHQGKNVMLLIRTQQGLTVSSIDADGIASEVYDGESFQLMEIDEFDDSLWEVMGNAVFSAQRNGNRVIGLVQDGQLELLNLSDDERFSTGIKAIYPGPVTLRVDMSNGEKLFIGQFLLDGAIPVVTEAERDGLYAQYTELYFNGSLVAKQPIDEIPPFDEPPFIDRHEALIPWEDIDSWFDTGYPHEMGREDYMEDDPYAFRILPYGYTLVSNIDVEDTLTVLLIDTFTGETRADLTDLALQYQTKTGESSPDSFFAEYCGISRSEDGSDLFFLDDAVYQNLKTEETKICTNADLAVQQKPQDTPIDYWEDTADYSWIYITIAAVLSPFIIVMIFIFVAKYSKDNMLKRGAKVVSAVILSIQRTSTTINDNPVCLFHLRFNWEGQTLERQARMTVDVLSPVQVGGQVLILYDPVKNKIRQATNTDVYSNKSRTISCCIERITYTEYENARSRMVILNTVSETGERIQVPAVEWKAVAYRQGDWVQLDITDPQGITIVGVSAQNAFPPKEERVPVRSMAVTSQEPGWYALDQKLVCYQVTIDPPLSVTLHVAGVLPNFAAILPGMSINTTLSQERYAKYARMAGKPQNAAMVRVVEITGEISMGRPFVKAQIEVAGQNGVFYLNELIEPYFGLQAGDTLWVAYDSASSEAILLRYADENQR